MKSALCVVAHPDDCVIFGLGLIHHTPGWRWHIAYLTYDPQDPRAREIAGFWHRRNVATQFLGHQDQWQDIESGQCSFDTVQADIDLRECCQWPDIILTHNLDGEYGHPHHVFVAQSVTQHRPDAIRFARPGQGTHEFSVPATAYDIKELPLHGDVIRGFHADAHRNHYLVPPGQELHTSL
jgi:LmbE family N-acetylglucosaminyl deacetylase